MRKRERIEKEREKYIQMSRDKERMRKLILHVYKKENREVY